MTQSEQAPDELSTKAVAIGLRMWSIAGMWGLAVVIALWGFHVTWGHLPGLMDVLLSLTLFAPLALPMGLARLLTHHDGLQWAIGLAFWPAAALLHVLWVWKGRWVFAGALVVLLALAGYQWLVMGVGMTGI